MNMKTHHTSQILLLTAMLAGIASATVVRPQYVPGLSAADSDGPSTPERMVDNSGMSPAVWTGTSLADTRAATHLFNAGAEASWLTHDPPPAAGDYFDGTNPDPVLVFDLGRNRKLATLFFWQLQRNPPVDSWAKEIRVRVAPEPPGGGPPNFAPSPVFPITLASPAALGPVNRTQEFGVPGIPTARYIELKIIDNLGGPRVGLGEFRVKVADHPQVELPAIVSLPSSPIPQTFLISLTNTGLPGQQPPQVFSLQNLSFSGPDRDRFAIDFTTGFTLPVDVQPGGPPVHVPVTYTPAGFGPAIARADFRIDSLAGLGGGSLEFATCGIAVEAPDPWLETTTPLAIGPFPRGVGAQRFSLEVWNKGDFADLSITDVSVSESTYFTIVAEAAGTIPPAAKRPFGGEFDPGADPGPGFSAEINLSSNFFLTPYPVTITASILTDLEISTPPVVTIPPLPAGTFFDHPITMNTELGTSYSLGEPVITGGAGLFTVASDYDEIINPVDAIVIRFAHDGNSGSYPLVIRVPLYDAGVYLSHFEVKVWVKVRNPVALVAHGFQADGRRFKVSVGNLLPGETFHLQKSTSLTTWTPLDHPNITAPGDYLLSPDRDAEPTLFLRLQEGPAP
jgi:hypothetical protein